MTTKSTDNDIGDADTETEKQGKNGSIEFTNPDDAMTSILTQTRTIAMIGASDRPGRDSYHVMEYLMNVCHYTVIPINPRLSEQHATILQQPVYQSITDVLQEFPHVDMIDIFRRSSDVPEIIQELIEYQKSHPSQQQPRCIWMQINVLHPKSAQLAEQHGFTVVMDKCPLHEIPRLQIKLPIHPKRM
jgi:uncharacterized protein